MQSTIERLSDEALHHVQSELCSLIGGELELTMHSASLIKKQGYLENQNGRNSIICLSMRGSYEGEGCLTVSENCAVRLAGKMLMLPSSEFNDIISGARYGDEEELRYAFDDIAKRTILAFLDLFQRSSTFISTITCHAQKIADDRKEMAEILGHLPAEQTYYQVSGTLTLAGVPDNFFSLLLPAFVLVCSEPFKQHTGQRKEQNSSLDRAPQNSAQATLFAEYLGEGFDGGEAVSKETAHLLISELLPVLQRELTDLLGPTVQIGCKGSATAPLAGLLSQAGATSHLPTLISLSGAARNRGWLIAETADAMRLGMLLIEGAPGVFIPTALAGPFSADCQDGYNEICAIFVEVLNIVLQDLSEGELMAEKHLDDGNEMGYPENDIQEIDDDPSWWLCSFEVAADKVSCGTMHLMLPLTVVDDLRVDETGIEVADGSTESPEPAVMEKISSRPGRSGLDVPVEAATKILLLEAAATYIPGILTAFESAGIEVERISPVEELSRSDLASYFAVLLVVDKLDEISLGMVIKLKSYSSIPLLVAATQWTQTDVMKALRYGVDDIVMLPAESEELVQKFGGLEPLAV